MQSKNPLTPALSPSDGEREKIRGRRERSPNGDLLIGQTKDSLSPSDGERDRVRGSFH
jgi:hypothetical protein